MRRRELRVLAWALTAAVLLGLLLRQVPMPDPLKWLAIAITALALPPYMDWIMPYTDEDLFS